MVDRLVYKINRKMRACTSECMVDITGIILTNGNMAYKELQRGLCNYYDGFTTCKNRCLLQSNILVVTCVLAATFK